MLIAKAGIEDDRRHSWFKDVAGQAAVAIQAGGVPLEGICFYPIVTIRLGRQPTLQQRASFYRHDCAGNLAYISH